jgi:hypothetical protein
VSKNAPIRPVGRIPVKCEYASNEPRFVFRAFF